MDFNYTNLSIRTAALDLRYYLVPWDTELLGRPVAQISQIEIHDELLAERDFGEFMDWCANEHIQLCACRISHARLKECMFLQQRGFQFIELNYRPFLANLADRSFSSDSIEIMPALPEDEEDLAGMARSIFRHGRFHQDPRLGFHIGNKRYETWLRNSFTLPKQTAYKCTHGEKIVGFFVVEQPQPNLVFWSLIGLAPALEGRGWGTRVWTAMMRFHQAQGAEKIETSISSHNTPVFNLYVKLGFRFPLPEATFHWHS